MTVNGGNTFWRAPQGAQRPRRTRPWVGLGLAIAALAYVLVFGKAGWLAVRVQQAEVNARATQLQQLEEKTAALHERIDALAVPGGSELERVARERHGMRAPGEEVYHVMGAAEESAAEVVAGSDPR